MTRPRHKNPWDEARRITLFRTNSFTSRQERLDLGVNYFVLKIEALGGKTRFSCEGHPFGFYLVFDMPYALTEHLARIGYFSVELGQTTNCFSLRLRGNEQGEDHGASWCERRKRNLLRLAAAAWEKKLPKKRGGFDA